MGTITITTVLWGIREIGKSYFLLPTALYSARQIIPRRILEIVCMYAGA